MHRPTFDPWVNTALLPLDPALITPAEAAKDLDRLPRLLLRPVRLVDERASHTYAEERGVDVVMALIAHLLLHVRGDWSLTGRTEPVAQLAPGASLSDRVAWLEENLTYKEARLISKAIWDQTKVTSELEGN